MPFGQDVPARALARREDVAPPLVRRLVSRDLEGEVDLRSCCSVRKPTPSENEMLVGKPWA